MPEIIEIEYSQTIGNVGYVLPMLEKLRVAEIIDNYCPKRCDGDYNHGEIINLMVCPLKDGSLYTSSRSGSVIRSRLMTY